MTPGPGKRERFSRPSGRDIHGVIPVRQGEERAVFWEVGGRTLLEQAIDRFQAPGTGIAQVFVAGSGLAGGGRVKSGPGVSILNVPIPPFATEAQENPLESVRQVAKEAKGPVVDLCGGEVDVVILDPLRPFISFADVQAAVQSFRLMDHGSRDRAGVVSMSRVRNHHHPKKVFRLSKAGSLVHYHQEGTGIYQRQQLRGDDYYVVDPALVVVGGCGSETDWESTGWAAVPINDNGVRVTDPETLALARALESGIRSEERHG